jgi:hypothetical protein
VASVFTGVIGGVTSRNELARDLERVIELLEIGGFEVEVKLGFDVLLLSATREDFAFSAVKNWRI